MKKQGNGNVSLLFFDYKGLQKIAYVLFYKVGIL